ncbi:MAG: oxygenase MpaB family protein [Polyangiales bacterium]
MNVVEQKIAAQHERIPVMYGRVDFSVLPERFTSSPADQSTLPAAQQHQRARLLADTERVGLIRAYTMLGDNVADAYAALMPEYGAKRLIGMLNEACARGVEHVANAPRELVAFIREMERTPAWLDMDLVEEGARRSRNSHAHVAPFVIRGAFFATFMNKYAALPMAITGTLSHQTAARRIRETATFFTTSVLPGALQRHGEGFRSAAMVRLMHSMVRYNVLTRTSWDTRVYGIPIPQVDQMPAGLISVFLMSRELLRRGRTSFNREERAIVELSRYRCYLLGLPEELLSDTPQGIVDLWLTRAATLRAGFDDATCGALVRSTMAADLSVGDSFTARLQSRMEHSFAKMFFLKNFANDDRAEAARLGVDVTRVDDVWATATGLWIASQIVAHELAMRVPGVRTLTDRRLVRMLLGQLQGYGHPEYATHAERYRPTQLAVA